MILWNKLITIISNIIICYNPWTHEAKTKWSTTNKDKWTATHIFRFSHGDHGDHSIVRDVIVTEGEGITHDLSVVAQAKLVIIFAQLIQDVQQLCPDASDLVPQWHTHQEGL